jgi:hypothetical protein
MTPEISHRCASCGASVREPAAMFCPECGQALSKPSPEPASQIVAAGSAPGPEKLAAEPSSTTPAETAPSKTGTYEKAREGLHRASTATREALADNVKRVERIRHVSSVVLEEAAYDPSLRFVLVALAIFVVFLVLLLLSKVMG